MLPSMKAEASGGAASGGRPSRAVLPLLLTAYASFYLCRSNVEPALSILAVDYGYDNEQLGVVLATALGVYGVGKLVFGAVADLWGGERVLVGSLFATVLVSFAIAASDAPRRFGAEAGLVVIGALVVLNRFVQSGGWSALVDVVGATFDPSRRGTVMGILASSYDVGDVLALVLSAAIVGAGAGWRALFVINPAIVLVVAVLAKIGLPARARERPRPTPSGAVAPAEPLRSIARRLALEPSFWFATGLSFLLTFVRAGFMTWTPRFLYEVSVAAGVASPMSGAIAKSAFFGVAGVIGSIVTGRLSDRLGPGRRAPLITVSLAVLVASTLALGHVGVSSPGVAVLAVAICGLFLLGPYSLLSGAVSLDIAGTRGAATAAGFIDGVGSVGAGLAAFVLGSVSKRAGWTAAFDLVAGVTFAALVLAVAWTLRRARPTLPA